MAIEPIRSLRAPATPPVVRAASLDRAEHRSFLANVVIEHGPRNILGRLFLMADTGLRERGIFVSFADPDEIKAINRGNPDSWSPILPNFDPDVSDVGETNFVGLVGRDASGRAIFTHASRQYEHGAGTLKDEIESLRLFYRDPDASARPGEAMRCSAPAASKCTGTSVFGGALWLHPERRGHDIQRFSGPIMRSLSFTRWQPDTIFSFMVPKLVEAGVAKAASLNVQYEVTMINTPVKRDGIIPAALVWITRDEQLRLFDGYLASISARGNAQVDGAVVQRAAKK